MEVQSNILELTTKLVELEQAFRALKSARTEDWVELGLTSQHQVTDFHAWLEVKVAARQAGSDAGREVEFESSEYPPAYLLAQADYKRCGEEVTLYSHGNQVLNALHNEYHRAGGGIVGWLSAEAKATAAALHQALAEQLKGLYEARTKAERSINNKSRKGSAVAAVYATDAQRYTEARDQAAITAEAEYLGQHTDTCIKGEQAQAAQQANVLVKQAELVVQIEALLASVEVEGVDNG